MNKNIYITFFMTLLLTISTKSVHAHSNAETSECSGSLFKMEGMKPADQALMITSAHCILAFSLGIKQAAVTNDPLIADVFLYKSHMDLGDIFSAKKLVYGTMDGIDFAIIELNITYAEVSRLGYKINEVSALSLKEGDALVFDSLYLQTTENCQIEKMVSTLKEAKWVSKNVYRLKKDEKCSINPGHLGTAGIIDGKIAAIVFTRYEGSYKACARNNPCEVEEAKESVAQSGQAYIFPTSFLYDCYDKSASKFDFSLEKCRK